MEIKCPKCGAALDLPDEAVGAKVQCPFCNETFIGEKPAVLLLEPARTVSSAQSKREEEASSQNASWTVVRGETKQVRSVPSIPESILNGQADKEESLWSRVDKIESSMIFADVLKWVPNSEMEDVLSLTGELKALCKKDGLSLTALNRRRKLLDELIKLHYAYGFCFDNDSAHLDGDPASFCVFDDPPKWSPDISPLFGEDGMGELLDTPQWKEAVLNSPGSVCFGSDEETELPIVVNIADIGHLLVGGVTGAGKTYRMNNILCSLCVGSSPNELEIVAWDNNILFGFNDEYPHVAMMSKWLPGSDSRRGPKFVRALEWVVSEMCCRERLFARVSQQTGSRIETIGDYNRLVDSGATSTSSARKLKLIVVMVDGYWELHTDYGEEITPLMKRLLNEGAATGIHVIVATSYPGKSEIDTAVRDAFPSRLGVWVQDSSYSKLVMGVKNAGLERLHGNGAFVLRIGSRLVHGKGRSIESSAIKEMGASATRAWEDVVQCRNVMAERAE